MRQLLQEIFGILETGRRVIHLLDRSEKIMLLCALAIMPATGILTNLPALLLGNLVDRMLTKATMDIMAALPTIGLIAATILAREIMTVVRKYIVENSCTRLQKTKTVEVVAHLLRLNLLHMGPNQRAGSLQGRMHRSIEGYVKLIKLSFLDLMPAIFTAICGLTAVAFKNPWLACGMAAVMPAGLVITLLQMKTQRGIRIDLLRAKEEIDGRVVELISGLEFIRAANTGPTEVSKMESSCERLRSREIKHHLWMAYFDAAKYLNEGMFQILILIITIGLACAGRASVGDVLSYSVLFAAVVAPLREIHRILDEGHESAIRTQDLFELMAWEEDPSNRVSMDPNRTAKPQVGATILELEDVCFTYPQSNGRGAGIRNLNLVVPRGETLGLVGPSGSGKSTLLRLVLGLVRPATGTIRLAGRNLADMTRQEIAEIVTFVTQTPFLFSGSVAENICYGCDNVTLNDMIEAAKAAQIHDEILALPAGYDSVVCERGDNFSGGQRQRIALARAFLRRTPLVAMDEATSALDNINEHKVQQAIGSLGTNVTLIVVAHRLSTIRQADRVIVLSEGQIVEEGDYAGLVDAGGLLAELQSTALQCV